MKIGEFKKKDSKELQKILEEKRVFLQKLKNDLCLGKLKNYKQIREIKKDIARILTILNEKTCQKENS